MVAWTLASIFSPSGSGHHACAPSVKHDRADCISFKMDCIVNTIHCCKEMVCRYHGGMDPCLNLFAFFLCNGKEFYLIAKLPGKLYIQWSNLAYALCIDILQIDICPIS